MLIPTNCWKASGPADGEGICRFLDQISSHQDCRIRCGVHVHLFGQLAVIPPSKIAKVLQQLLDAFRPFFDAGEGVFNHSPGGFNRNAVKREAVISCTRLIQNRAQVLPELLQVLHVETNEVVRIVDLVRNSRNKSAQ